MADPLDALLQPTTGVDPRPAFAAALRRRLERALADTDPAHQQQEGESAPMTTIGRTALVPYLAVSDARAAIAFYQEGFGAVETTRIVQPDGRVGHAELSIGEAGIMLADEFPEIGVLSPRTLGGSAVSLHLEVPDVDAFVARAVAAGATLERPVADQFHGNRNGVIVDPAGHRWMISTPIAPTAG